MEVKMQVKKTYISQPWVIPWPGMQNQTPPLWLQEAAAWVTAITTTRVPD